MDIYEHIEPIDAVGDLYMAAVEESVDFQEAIKEEHWKSAMKIELEAITKK